MYHDELNRQIIRPREMSGRRTRTRGDVAGAMAIELGGGVSLAMFASLAAQPVLAILFNLGGLLPLVSQSLVILVDRFRPVLDRLKPLDAPETRPRLAIPYDRAEATAIRGPSRARTGARVMAGPRRQA